MDTDTLKISLLTREYHTPSSFQIAGIIRIQITGNTRVRIKEIAADTAPSFNAVKKAEEKMLNHMIRNGRAQMVKALVVRASSSGS